MYVTQHVWNQMLIREFTSLRMNIWIETCCVTYNDTLLLGKYYIYSKKCQNSLPTHRGFIVRTKRVSNIELHIAKEKNKLLFHLQNWEKLINGFGTY